MKLCVTNIFVLLEQDLAVAHDITWKSSCTPKQSIFINPQSSIAYLRTECVGYALTDATKKAIELNGSYVKGYYRRACRYIQLDACR